MQEWKHWGQRGTSIGTVRGRTMCGQQSVLVGTIQAKNGRANHISRKERITQLQVLTVTEESGLIRNKGRKTKEVAYDNDDEDGQKRVTNSMKEANNRVG
jgi:hypothetical protein